MKDSAIGVPTKTLEADTRARGGCLGVTRPPYIILLICAAAAAIVFIDPVREMATEDDGWAYGRMVQSLLATGEYHLSAWAAPNMPTQIFLAAGLSKLFGYSFTTLRCSTLLLLGVACLSLYRLLREFGCGVEQAATLSFALFCSPFVLLLGFTFNTDVHFIGWLLLALWLYARAVRLESLGLMLLGSVAAAAAIGVRQFGMAIIGGLFIAWTLQAGRRFRSAPLFLAGALLPAAAALWQLKAGFQASGFSQAMSLCIEARFLAQGTRRLLGELVWRVTVILEYASLYLVPLLPALVFLARATWRAKSQQVASGAHSDGARFHGLSGHVRAPDAVMRLVLWSGVVVLGVAFGILRQEQEGSHFIRQPMMPSIPWMLGLYLDRFDSETATWLSWLFTIFAIPAAIALAWLLSARVPARPSQWRLSPPMGLVLGTGLLILALHISFAVLNDTYVTALLPFVLFVLALSLQDAGWPRPSVHVAGAALVGFLFVFSGFLHLEFGRLEARWSAAQSATAAGIDPAQIDAGYHWALYHGAFDQWAAAVGERSPAEAYCRPYRMQNAFDAWLNDRRRESSYVVATGASPPDCKGCGKGVPYRNRYLERRYAYYAPRRAGY